MSEKNKKKTVKAKIKTELGYMKKGAKILPKVLAKKGKQWVKAQVQAAKERAKAEREIEAAAKAAEREAYKTEAIRQAKLRGRLKAKKGRAGWRGALQEVGEIGERMSLGGVLGVETKKPERVVRRSEMEGLAGMSSSSYLFSGLGKKKKKKE
jgi:hypothetical protein